MTTASSRFYPRAPRYTLRSDDDNQMRFALMQTRGAAHDTELKNVSSSGLAFTVFNGEVPRNGLDEGDIIKIEFRIPNGKQIACFATVIRVEQIEQWHPEFGNQVCTEVAVKFRHLPSAFANSLQGLIPKNAKAEEDVIVIAPWPTHLSRRALLLFSLSSIAMFSIFFLLIHSPRQWFDWIIK